jgi:uncharacterized membrane protein YhaH (DUF805 family)
MDWNWFLFSFEGRISRAKIWLAAFIWFTTVFSCMTIFTWVVAGFLRASGNDSHFVSSKTIHPAFYLLGLPLLVIAVLLFAATVIKRLHDRDKRGLWFAVLFIAPRLLDNRGDRLDNPLLASLASGLGLGLSVWCFVELFCLRGTKGPNRFGLDPLAPIAPTAPVDTWPRWDQQSELEFVPYSASAQSSLTTSSPPAGPHVKRRHD